MKKIIPNKKLLPREKECLYWTAMGKTVEEISMILGITFHTARYYIQTMREKLDSTTAAQAVYTGMKQGIIK